MERFLEHVGDGVGRGGKLFSNWFKPPFPSVTQTHLWSVYTALGLGVGVETHLESHPRAGVILARGLLRQPSQHPLTVFLCFAAGGGDQAASGQLALPRHKLRLQPYGLALHPTRSP